jgi:hypothetical protein
MLEPAAQIATVFALAAWVWVVPNAFAGRRLVSPPRWLLRFARRCQGRVDTRPRRRQAARWGYTTFVYDGPGLPDGYVPPSTSPDVAAGPSTWTPNRVAAMPRERCKSCPVFGCYLAGQDPECEWRPHTFRRDCSCEKCSAVEEWDPIYSLEGKTVAWAPRLPPVDPGVDSRRPNGRGRVWSRSAPNLDHVSEALRMMEETQRLRAREAELRERVQTALDNARQPRPGDTEVAKPPRDLFDKQQPTWRPTHTGRPLAELPDPLYPPSGGPDLGGLIKRLTERRPHRKRPSGAQRRRKLRQQAEFETLRWEADKGRKCGACDKSVLDFFDGPWIEHAVGCPRRAWPVDRATLPRPGQSTRVDTDGMRPYRPVATDKVRK